MFLLTLFSLAIILFAFIASCNASSSNNNSSPHVVAVDTAGSLSVALMSDGTIWAWGESSLAHLGPTNMDTMPNQFDFVWTPVNCNVSTQLNISNVKSVSIGDNYIIFLKEDGTIWAWGDNQFGQLGNGEYDDTKNNVNKEIVQVANLTNIIAISAGGSHCLALKNDGTIWAWGSNRYGELGDGKTSNGEFVPVQVTSLSHVIGISAGYFYSVALTDNGSVWTWGNNGFDDGNNESRPFPVKLSISNVTAISAGLNDYSLALKRDGTVWIWGDNVGQYLDEPVKIGGLSGIVAVSAGNSQSMALGGDGSVWIWGENQEGQLGLGVLYGPDITTPVKVSGLTNIVMVSTGNFYNLALSNDGTVWGWGDNRYGQIGNGIDEGHVLSPSVIIKGSSTPLTISTTPNPIMTNNVTTPKATDNSQHGDNTNIILILGVIGVIFVISLMIYMIIRYLRSS